MAKCIFDKKANTKGYRRCEVTKQYKCCRCDDNYIAYPCKWFKASLWSRFWNWLYNFE